MATRRYIRPFSGDLWTQHERLSSLPALKKSDAKSLWLTIGIAFGLLGGGMAFALYVNGTIRDSDPMLSTSLAANFVFWTLLALVTARIGYKQWCYYYGGSSPKDGIFVNKIRQANEQEQALDVALSIAGGLLVGFVFWPSFWFLAFAAYCQVVTLRCWVTLRRPRYARAMRQRGEIVPEFIEEVLDKQYNGLLVKALLVGWIISDIIYAVYDIIAFVICYFLVGKMSIGWRYLFFAITIGILAVLFLHVVRKHSYQWGLRWIGAAGEPGIPT